MAVLISTDMNPSTTKNDEQARVCPAQARSALSQLISSGPRQRSMDERTQLFAHRNGARRQQLREENDNHVVNRAHPEEGPAAPPQP